jgi:hypothetical protein
LFRQTGKEKEKLFLDLITHHIMKAHGGVDVQTAEKKKLYFLKGSDDGVQ